MRAPRLPLRLTTIVLVVGCVNFGKVSKKPPVEVAAPSGPVVPPEPIAPSGPSGPSAPSASTTIGGSVANLYGSGLVLALNGGEQLAVAANGAFAFQALVEVGATYEVTVSTQPVAPAQICTVASGSGIASTTPVVSVSVNCATQISECRGAAGACDVAELNDAAGNCPADAKATAGTVCRPTACTGDVAETCNGISDQCPSDAVMHLSVFGASGPTGTVVLTGNNTQTRAVMLPANAVISSARFFVSGIPHTPANPVSGSFTLPGGTFSFGTYFFYRPSERGSSYWFGSAFGMPVEMKWDGSTDLAGSLGSCRLSGPSGATGFTYGCAADETSIYCVTANGAGTDAWLAKGNAAGTGCTSPVTTFSGFADKGNADDTKKGLYGVAFDGTTLYLLGGTTGALGYGASYLALDGSQSGIRAVSGGEGTSGMSYLELPFVPLKGGIVADCSAGCVFASNWKETGGAANDDVMVLDTAFTLLGTVNFTNANARHAGLMVSDVAPNGDVVDASYWVGYYDAHTVSTYTYYSPYPRNFRVDIGALDATPEWTLGSLSNANWQVTPLAAPLSAALAAGACSCPGCILSSGTCTIPVAFSSRTAGSFSYANLDVAYTCH